MQTILGAGGAIGTLLAKELKNYTPKIRLAARNPRQVHSDDELFSCDLKNKACVSEAVKGSDIAYLTAGLTYNLKVWKREWPVVMGNVINACLEHNCKLVFFDNVYMYHKNHLANMTENTPVAPPSEKGKVRHILVRMIEDAMEQSGLQALIARSADFYGPGANASILKIGVTDNLLKNKKAFWQADDGKIHSLTYTPDAAKAVALLGNTPDAYRQAWHLPTSKEKLTGKELIALTAAAMNKEARHYVLSKTMVSVAGIFVPILRELKEMLYQYDRDYFFDSSKFDQRFQMQATSYAEGIKAAVQAVSGT
ncbi:NAD-dependent epimerase/dehydratase family protein [Haoranjiania flava]|uniref:NAD-dependent epimerase/dehydratase family protein n=1 Tax=Haoranjiania flava TaxID=1856322 RepID=A0AAE3IMI3_9BACT|nr:NAD-dependent epimerase/dehydratase family protein [Haoranjiania flava]MCU7693786.1 NAD-dependent epimerase/dehydratase family protein [Haoranjiania flava]